MPVLHTHQQSLCCFSLNSLLSIFLPYSLLSQVSHFPTVNSCAWRRTLLPPHTPRLTLRPREDATSTLLQPHSQVLPQETFREKRKMPPQPLWAAQKWKTCCSLQIPASTGSLLGTWSLETLVYWELTGNLELRNLSMSIDAYTEKHKLMSFSITRNPCSNMCNFIQRHNLCLAVPWLLTVLHLIKMGRSFRPSEEGKNRNFKAAKAGGSHWSSSFQRDHAGRAVTCHAVHVGRSPGFEVFQNMLQV